MLMKGIQERRQTTRLQLGTPVKLSDEANNISFGKVINLSATGALIKTDVLIPINKAYSLSIKLKGDSSNLLIDNLQATVVRHEGDTVGIKFAVAMEWLTLFYVYRKKLNLDQV